MNRNAMLQFLKSIELFSGLNNKELQEVSKNLKEKYYSPGDVLFHENSPRKAVFIIYEGEVELYKHNSYGIKVRLALFSRGDFLGEGIWDQHSPHSTSALVMGKAILFVVDRELFSYGSGTTLKIMSNITRIISRRIRNANNRMLNLSTQYESGRTRTEHDLLGKREVPYEPEILKFKHSGLLRISISRGSP